jgi:hypothetical protein
MVFRVRNRGVGRMRLFDDDDDWAAFERVLTETLEIQPMRVCAYCGLAFSVQPSAISREGTVHSRRQSCRAASHRPGK